MSIEEPTFSYANGALDDAETLKRRAHESAVRQALASEAKAHQWEHKQPGPRAVAYGQLRNTRIFTREEVLTVIRTLKASWQVHGSEDYDNGAKRAFADMAATIANME